MWTTPALAPLMIIGVPALLAIAWFWLAYGRLPVETGMLLNYVGGLLLVASPMAYRVLSHKPVLAFYAEGLWLGGLGLVPWQEIVKAEELDRTKGYREGTTCMVTFRPPAVAFWAEPLIWTMLMFCCRRTPDGCTYGANAIDYNQRENHLHRDEKKGAKRLAALIEHCAAEKDNVHLKDILHQAAKGHF